ncbi:MAG TPA: AMP-binding protein [Dysgonamonadaceae bacterium]|nr:AMP-binding protein [Dysgonamonadaceae bacterium]
MGLWDYTIYDVICRNAAIFPEKEGIVFGDRRLTYRKFKEKCDQAAAGLRHLGISQGDRIAVVSYNCDDFMILYGAAAKIGAIILPVNWRFQRDELEYVLNDCTPKLCFVGSDFCQTLAEVRGKVMSVELFFTLGGGETREGFYPFDSIYKNEEAVETPDIQVDSGFVIIHTAAVGGRPRGAVLSQRNILSIGMSMMYSNDLSSSSCHLCILPLFHIGGLALTMATMQAGGKNVLVDRFNPENTLRLIDSEKGTTFLHFAPILKMLRDKYDELGGVFNLSSLENVGGLDHPDNLKRFKEIAPQVNFLVGFGQTEALEVTGCRIDERPGSAGRPTHISKVVLFDDNDQEVPIGSLGEICVRGPAVFLGYWGREDDNAYTFRNGWHHTGDMGRFDEDGYLWYAGRKPEKELIKPGGENVYPVEVEKVILRHGDVEEVVVIGVPDTEWGEAVQAICVRKKGKTVDAAEIIKFVGSKIAGYKKPKHVLFVDSLPKTASGAIDRDKVKKEYAGKN